jgi:hypothetical protein
MQKRISYFIILLSVLVNLYSDFEIIKLNDNNLELCFKVPDYQINEENGVTSLDFNGIVEMQPKGEFNLPEFGKFINIPQGYKPTVSYEIIKTEKIKFTAFKKSHGFSDKDKTVTSTKFSNNEIVSISEPGIMRDLVLGKLMIKPFRVHESSIEIFEEIKIEVNFLVDNNMDLPVMNSSCDLTDMYNENSLNPILKNERNTEMPGKYLFIYNGEENIRQILDYLAEWKNQKGHPVEFASTSDIGTTNHEIKDYIVNIYNNSIEPLEYVCLVGDSDADGGIPPFTNQVNDYPILNDFNYSLVDGDDNLPDILVSRLSYNSISELQTQVAKIIAYELDVQDDGHWADKYLLVGDYLYSGSSTIHTVQNVGEYIQNYNSNANILELYNAPFNTGIINALNSQIGAIFWRGFGNLSDLYISHLTNLTNSRVTPFGVFISCVTCQYYTGNPTVIEEILSLGTPSSPKGLISAIGTTNISHTCFNNIITTGIGKYLYEYEGNNLVAAMNYGLLEMEENFPSNPCNYNDWYRSMLIHLGDPGLDLWLSKPQQFQIVCDSLFANDSQYDLQVLDENDCPIEGAVVTFLGDNYSKTYLTDQSGVIVTNFENTDIDCLKLTISKDGFKPIVRNLENVIGSSIECHSVNFTSYDAGNSSALNLEIINNTGNTFTETGQVTTNSTYITFENTDIIFTNISPNSIGSSDNTVNFDISDNCPDQERILFNIEFNDFSFPVEMLVSNHNLVIQEMTSSSNIVAGANIDLSFVIRNDGVLSSEDCIVGMRIFNSAITMIDSVATLEGLNSAECSEALSFEIELSENIQNGIQFGILEFNQSGFQYNLEFEFEVESLYSQSSTTSDGTTYQIIHNNDLINLNPPEYSWVELDPEEGGNGVELPLSLQDAGHPGELWHIELPFDFKFHGLNYQEITICSNGFVIPGSSDYLNWMNTTLPSPMAYDPIIAPFWDALIYDENNHIFTYYDSEDGCYIVQWKNMQTRTNRTSQEFQLIIYDEEYHQTVTIL